MQFKCCGVCGGSLYSQFRAIPLRDSEQHCVRKATQRGKLFDENVYFPAVEKRSYAHEIQFVITRQVKKKDLGDRAW